MIEDSTSEFLRELDAIIARAHMRLEQYEIHAQTSKGENAAWDAVSRMKTSISRLERLKSLAQGHTGARPSS